MLKQRLFDRSEDRECPYPGLGKCRVWVGKLGWDGYGLIKLKGRRVRAHRVSYSVNCGPIPDGLCVLHHCDVRNCIQPSHLFLGDDATNTADKMDKGRAITPVGDRNGSARLNERDVRIIRLRGKSGGPNNTPKKIAADFGVGLVTIKDVLDRRTWKHI